MENFTKNFRLKQYNTFHLDVTCDFYFEFGSTDQLVGAIRTCQKGQLPWMILGTGANVLFATDFRGVILRSVMDQVTIHEGLVVVESGAQWDWFVQWAVENNMGGIENLSYIPSSVGAAPIQNIGAYGAQVSDTIAWVEYLDTQQMNIVRIEGTECKFGYRESVFKHELKGKAIITRVAFALEENPQSFNIEYGDLAELVAQKGGASLHNIREAVTQIRKSKLPEPDELGNAGSFFKNPVISPEQFEVLKEKFADLRFYPQEDGRYKVPAGWLIERSGWKGRRLGEVGVHQNQALVLVNYGNGTSTELINLAQEVISSVKELSGIELEMEVNLIES
ncbi:MAG: UDP-N-acetylmuramate dehydrogenase [Rikenellaceae bacterium]